MTQDVGRGRTVLIAGGGIGGLSAAASLAGLGFRVKIFEQADDFREVGAGIQVGPNGIRAIKSLGLLPQVNEFTWHPSALIMRDAFDASDICRIPLGERFRQRFHEPYAVIHRADLLGVLLQACRDNPLIELSTCARLAHIDELNQGVRITLEDGRRFEGDLLIGADGLRSVVRQTIIGDGAPRPPRYVVYRGVIERHLVPDSIWEPDVVMWTGPDADFVHYPLRRGELFNLVVTFKAQADLDPFDIAGSRDEMCAPYENFHPTVRTLLQLLPADRKWLVTDRAPMHGWSQGRATLIGDAAHPMLQYMAQGACQALEDVAQLIDELRAQPDDLPVALLSYAGKRYHRTARVQFSARQMIELCQVSGALADLRARYFRERSAEQLYDGLAWLYSPLPNERFA